MAEPKIYPKGLRTFPKNANAPSFVLGSLILAPNDLFNWIKENEHLLTEYNGAKQLKLQILSGDKGIYFTVDTFKATPANGLTNMKKEDIAHQAIQDESDDLPF